MTKTDTKNGGLGLRITRDVPPEGLYCSSALLRVPRTIAKEQAIKYCEKHTLG